MRRAVIVTKCDQWANLQFDRGSSPTVREGSCSHFVSNDCCVLSLHHEHRFLEPHSFSFISEHRKRIETETDLIFKALWMNRTRVLIRRQLVTAAVDNQRLFQLR